MKKQISGKTKIITLIVSLALICTAAVGVTVAYITASTDPKENVFTPAEVTCEVIEDTFDGSVKKNVKIKNTGDTPAYIRAAIVATWVSAEGNKVSAILPEKDVDYTLTYGDSEKWQLAADGYWYYTEPVSTNSLTDVLISSCAPVEDKAPDGFVLSVEIVASAIQSSPDDAVKEAWGMNVNNGALKIILPSASPVEP